MDKIKERTTDIPTLPEAIILQAVSDWRHLVRLGKESAVLGNNGKISLAELRAFFKSDWCAMLCGKINPLFILRRLEKERVDALNGKKRKPAQKKEKVKAREISFEYNGETHTIKEWAQITGIRYQVLYSRLVIHLWDVERALTEQVKPYSFTTNNNMEVHT